MPVTMRPGRLLWAPIFALALGCGDGSSTPGAGSDDGGRASDQDPSDGGQTTRGSDGGATPGGHAGGATSDGGMDDGMGDGMGDGMDDGGLHDAGPGQPPSCDDSPVDDCTPSCADLPGDYVQQTPGGGPPYSGTVWYSPDIITDSDPSAFAGLTHTGTGSRQMFDRRTGAFETLDAHLFDARFGTTVTVEFQVNPEFTLQQAQDAATRYAQVIGKLPVFLFRDLETVWIHRGLQPFGGGNRNLLIHTEQADAYIADGVLEETFLHEATHTSIDGHHASAPDWQAAQAADGIAISTYAQDFPAREDLSETLGPYLAIRFRADRLDAGQIDAVKAAIPNRLEYLDCQGLSMALVP